jgi:hypothetical protein
MGIDDNRSVKSMFSLWFIWRAAHDHSGGSASTVGDVTATVQRPSGASSGCGRAECCAICALDLASRAVALAERAEFDAPCECACGMGLKLHCAISVDTAIGGVVVVFGRALPEVGSDKRLPASAPCEDAAIGESQPQCRKRALGGYFELIDRLRIRRAKNERRNASMTRRIQ